jgi:DNA-binding response OmpR family regulator
MIGPLEFAPEDDLAGFKDRSVEVYIRRLRVKLGKAAPDWDHIHTHFNIGYRLDPEPRTGRQAADP